jgi:hypothetical protein
VISTLAMNHGPGCPISGGWEDELARNRDVTFPSAVAQLCANGARGGRRLPVMSYGQQHRVEIQLPDECGQLSRVRVGAFLGQISRRPRRPVVALTRQAETLRRTLGFVGRHFVVTNNDCPRRHLPATILPRPRTLAWPRASTCSATRGPRIAAWPAFGTPRCP